MSIDRVNEIFGRPPVSDQDLMREFNALGALNGDSTIHLSTLTRPISIPGNVEFYTYAPSGQVFLWRIEPIERIVPVSDKAGRSYLEVHYPHNLITRPFRVDTLTGQIIDQWGVQDGDLLAEVFKLDPPQPTSYTNLYRAIRHFPHPDTLETGDECLELEFDEIRYIRELKALFNLTHTPTAAHMIFDAIRVVDNAPKVAREVELLARFGKNGHDRKASGILSENGKHPTSKKLQLV